MFRQGDVLLIRVTKETPWRPITSVLPLSESTIPFSEGDCVLAEGEVTGHAHRVKGRVKLFGAPGAAERILKVAQATVLEHEEHAPIMLPRGTYRVLIQKEYSPEAVRNVAD